MESSFNTYKRSKIGLVEFPDDLSRLRLVKLPFPGIVKRDYRAQVTSKINRCPLTPKSLLYFRTIGIKVQPVG